MMASATYMVQGSYSTSPPGPCFWSRGSKLKRLATSHIAVVNKDRFVSLKCRSCSSVGASLVLGPKSNLFKISAFKGSNQRDDSGGRANGSNPIENPLKVSYLQHRSDESSLESSKVQNAVPAPYASPDEMTTSSLAIQKLFKSWLMLLHVPQQPQAADEVLEEPSSPEASEMSRTVQMQERDVNTKSFWCYLLGLDMAIKAPLLIFGPLCLAVTLVYGLEVSKELAPLWILGPVAIALYIKTFRAICAIYAFSFKQSVKLIKNTPVYYLLIHDYIVHGKLKGAIRWKSLEDLKKTDYNAVTRRKMKDLLGWLMERYLDFVESIWPYYCRTIRFLKRANLI